MAIYERLRRRGIYIAMRRGRLRISPHIHLTSEDIAQALDALNDCPSNRNWSYVNEANPHSNGAGDVP